MVGKGMVGITTMSTTTMMDIDRKVIRGEVGAAGAHMMALMRTITGAAMTEERREDGSRTDGDAVWTTIDMAMMTDTVDRLVTEIATTGVETPDPHIQ